MTNNHKTLLMKLFKAAVNAAQPANCLIPHLPPRPKGRLVVIGYGKSAAAMAQVVEQHYGGDIGGVVVTRHGYGRPCQHIKVLEAAHPVPDATGVAATAEILEAVQGLSEDDLVLCLVSGGGSALFVQPPEGIQLKDKQQLTQNLLRSGATISEMNKVRKRFSLVKGGRLARAVAPAPMLALVISDVPGDDLAQIASGPTVADPTTVDEVRDILNRYNIQLSPTMGAFLDSPAARTPDVDDPVFRRVEHIMVATPQQSLEAAAKVASEHGYKPYILSDRMEGESRVVAKVQAAMARQIISQQQPFSAPCVLLSGGETTVTISGDGKGGPNSEFCLSLALALQGLEGVSAIACDTDGVDGSEDNAGATIGPETLQKAADKGLDGAKLLHNNDAYSFFAALDDLVMTGPTFTNVNDFRAIVVSPA